MARFLKKREAANGKAPGEIIFIGERKVEESRLEIIDYDGENLIEKDIKTLDSILPFKDSPTVTWLNITGLHDTGLIKKTGTDFGLHALVLDDIVNTSKRPVMKEYDDYIFMVLKMMYYDEPTKQVKSEHLSIVLGETFLITFQERPGDIFDPLRDRIRKQKGRIRKAGLDYLAYAVLDIIVENYIMLIEAFGEQIEDLDDEILENPDKKVLSKIQAFKQEMNFLRKTIRPVKDFILQLSRLDSDLLQEHTLPYIKDLLDLSTQAVEVIDSYRVMLSDQMEIYNTGINNRLNEIMKVLTIFSAIFIPLTFIAGIYGTNFDNLPELHFKYSYFIFWGVLVLVAVLMLRFFKRKKWL